jgi:thymidylate synthase (FAD)
MKIKLISYSQPTEELRAQGIDDLSDLVAFCARVSNPSNQFNTETADKLLDYLIRYKHFSPFEMVGACLEITTTRDIARQVLRHRSFTFQEFSQRYASPIKEFDLLIREARFQDPKNRQNSVPIDYNNDEQRQIAYQWEILQKNLNSMVHEAYTWAISKGIAKEVARAILPEGNTESVMLINGTLRSWIHYCELRSENGTQLEHIQIAKACAKMISKIYPQMKVSE